MVRNKELFIKLGRSRIDVNPPSKKQPHLLLLDTCSARAQRKSDVYNARAQGWSTQLAIEETEEVFYDELKMLWLVFRVLGLFPVQKPAFGKATFRWFSKEMLYAFCFSALLGVLIWFEIREKGRLALKSKDHFDAMMFAILMLMYTVPPLWLCLRHWISAAQLASLMNDWVTFQTEFRQVTRHSLRLNIRHRCTIVVLSMIVACYLYAIAQHYVLDEGYLKKWEIIYYGYAVILLNLHLFLWYLLCLLSSMTSRRMMHYMLQDLSWAGSSGGELVSRYRHLWLHLSRLTRQFGHVFCYQFANINLFWFTTFLLSVYYLSTISRRPTVIHLGVALNVVIIFSSIVIFCQAAHNATDEVGEVVKEKLQKINTNDKKTREQLRLFENTIFQNPPVISLGGYVQVNRQLAVSMFSTTLTYLVVMVQFDMSETSEAAATGNGTA